MIEIAGVGLPGFLKDQLVYDFAWLLLALPLTAFLTLLSARRKRPTAITWISLMSITAAIAVLALAVEAHRGSTHASLYRWISFIDGGMAPTNTLTLPLGLLIDPLSAIFLFAFTAAVLLVGIQSLVAMRGDDGYVRHYRGLALLAVAGVGILAATNLFQVVFFWGLLSWAGYLLLGHSFTDVAAARGARRTLVALLATDGALMLLLAYWQFRFGELTLGTLHNDLATHKGSAAGLAAAGLLLAIAAAGRSAVFPFQAWLTGAVEGPGASLAALVGAGNLLAGGYLLLRLLPLLAASDIASALLGAVGGVGLILVAILALAATDYRRLVALLAAAQLALTFLAIGAGFSARGAVTLLLGTWLVTLLLLVVATVIRAMRTSDITLMGGVAARMPNTARASLVASILILIWDALAVAVLFEASQPVLATLALVGAFLLAVAVLRAHFRVFSGDMTQRRAFEPRRVRDAERLQTAPFTALGLLSLLFGLTALPVLTGTSLPGLLTWLTRYVAFGGSAHADRISPLGLTAALVVVAAGAGLAWAVYGARTIAATSLRGALGPVPGLTDEGYHLDTAYDHIGPQALGPAARGTAWLDQHVIDRTGAEIGSSLDEAGALARRLEFGPGLAMVALAAVAAVVVLGLFLVFHAGLAPVSVGIR